jgi:hypothetical protein
VLKVECFVLPLLHISAVLLLLPIQGVPFIRAVQVGTVLRSGTTISQRFRGGLACKAHRRVYHSTVGSREVKKKRVPLLHIPAVILLLHILALAIIWP